MEMYSGPGTIDGPTNIFAFATYRLGTGQIVRMPIEVAGINISVSRTYAAPSLSSLEPRKE